MQTSFYKMIGLLLALFIILPVVVGCEVFKEEKTQSKPVYLNLGISNPYGIKTLEPGRGRFIYDKEAVADIELETAEGYNFLGWEGEDGTKVTKETESKYILQMNKDREINASLELKDFKPLQIDYKGIDPVSYSQTDGLTNVPHNLENVSIKFNNKLHKDNELEATIVDNNQNEDAVDSDQIEIKDNFIQIALSDWRDRFYSDEEEDNYLEFGKEYILNVYEASTGTNIFDIKNNEIDKEIAVDFVVEEPYPAVPGNFTLEIEQGTVKLSWIRSKTNAKIDIEEYVKDYVIYKSKNKEELKDEDEIDENKIEVININITDDLGIDTDTKILRYEDNVNLDQNQYYYRIKAVNDYNNESRLSEIVGTD